MCPFKYGPAASCLVGSCPVLSCFVSLYCVLFRPVQSHHAQFVEKYVFRSNTPQQQQPQRPVLFPLCPFKYDPVASCHVLPCSVLLGVTQHHNNSNHNVLSCSLCVLSSPVLSSLVLLCPVPIYSVLSRQISSCPFRSGHVMLSLSQN